VADSAWHVLSEEKITWTGGDEIGLDAAYLVSVIVEQALTVYGATTKTASRQRSSGVGRTTLAATTADNKGGEFSADNHRGRCFSGYRRRRSQVTVGDGPGTVRRLLRDVYADAATANIVGDSDLVRFVLGRLHTVAAAAAADFLTFRCWRWWQWRRADDGRGHRGLGPPLALFLRQLYDVSHATCWHLDEWRRRRDRDELRSLGTYAKLLCRNAVPPTEALLDAADKGTIYTFGFLFEQIPERVRTTRHGETLHGRPPINRYFIVALYRLAINSEHSPNIIGRISFARVILFLPFHSALPS